MTLVILIPRFWERKSSKIDDKIKTSSDSNCLNTSVQKPDLDKPIPTPRDEYKKPEIENTLEIEPLNPETGDFEKSENQVLPLKNSEIIDFAQIQDTAQTDEKIPLIISVRTKGLNVQPILRDLKKSGNPSGITDVLATLVEAYQTLPQEFKDKIISETNQRKIRREPKHKS